MPHTVRMLMLALLTVTQACAGKSEEGDEGVSPDHSPVRVEVTNDHALPVEIFAVGAGISHRLGTVHPGMSAQFALPENLIGTGNVELQATPGAPEQPFRSGPLLLSPGTIVDLHLTPQLFNSTATIRP